MLAKARMTRCYDQLYEAEMVDYLRSVDNNTFYDVILAADVLVYVGSLSPLMEEISKRLKPGGSFVFTVEELASNSEDTGYSIGPRGRYIHSAEYIKKEAAKTGILEVKAF